MAERFVKITVSKELFTDIVVKIDDENQKFLDIFSKDNKLKFPRFEQNLIDKAVEETVNDYEWEEDTYNSYHSAKEIPKEEAIQYKVWDAIEDQEYKQ